MHLAGLHGALQRLAIRVGHHQHLAGARVHRHHRHQPAALREVQASHVDHRGTPSSLADLVGERGVGGEPASPEGGAPTLPVGEGGAGLLQDGEERCRVPGGERLVGHHLRASGGHQQVAVAVTPGPAERRPLGEGMPAGAALGVLEEAVVGDQHARVLHAADLRGPGPLVVPEAALARCSDQQLVHGGEPRGAAQGTLSLEAGHQGAPQRNPAHEGPRAVDGIDDPAPLGAGAQLAELLAQETVLGEALRSASRAQLVPRRGPRSSPESRPAWSPRPSACGSGRARCSPASRATSAAASISPCVLVSAAIVPLPSSCVFHHQCHPARLWGHVSHGLAPGRGPRALPAASLP